MDTIKSAWMDFKSKVIPADASVVQKMEMKRAFYAGATSTLAILDDISSDDVPDEVGAAIINGLAKEVTSFFTGI